jgi:D-arabinose 1-dehydrogenase-like Zn-dependent alcohol dehydrogenase
MEGSHVVVIGAGPGGLLAAAHFAASGARVTVYERRSAEQQRSLQLGWTIALGKVATDAIEDAGISANFGLECKSAPPVHPSACPARICIPMCCLLLQEVALVSLVSSSRHLVARAYQSIC